MSQTLALGTAQFGSPYGISNARGRVSEDEVRQILEYAAQCKILHLDVAPYDGDVERILGRCWPFPSPFKPQVRTVRGELGLDWLETRLRRSVEYMGLARADSALIDCAEDLLGPQGDAIWSRLQKLKSQGLISRIGISIHPEDEPLGLASRFKPDIMQVSASIFDQRLIKNGVIEDLASRDIEVQVRSIFLQGLLFVPREALPANLAPIGMQFSRIRRHLLEACADPLHAALSFAQNIKGVSRVIVGVTSAAELRAIITASARKAPNVPWSALALDDEIALDPRQWYKDLGLEAQRRHIKAA